MEVLLRLLCVPRPRAKASRIEIPDLAIPPAHEVGNGIARGFVPSLRSALPRPAAPVFVFRIIPASPLPSPPRGRNDLVVYALHSLPPLPTSFPNDGPFPIFPIEALNALCLPRTMATAPHNAGLSQSWISPAASNLARFNRLQVAATYLGVYRSPFFPHTAPEWNKHNAEMKATIAIKQRKVLEDKIRVLECRRKERNVNGDRVLGEEAKINQCELTFAFKDEQEISEGEKKGELGWSVGLSLVLTEKTSFWAGGEHELKEGRVDEENGMRAFWPEMSELKYEGEIRLRRSNSRRLPLPRLDLYSTGMLRHFMPPTSPLIDSQKASLINQIIVKKQTEDIAWFERQVVPFKHELDKLPCLDKLWEANEETNNGGPYFEVVDKFDEQNVEEPVDGGESREGIKVKEEVDVGIGSNEKYEEGFEPGTQGYEQNKASESVPAIETTPLQDQDRNASTLYSTDIHNQASFHGPSLNYDSHGHPLPEPTSFGTYGPQPSGNYEDPIQPLGSSIYDGLGLPLNYSDGARGPGSGKKPPVGGWMFDEGELRKNGDWADLLNELDCAGDLEA